jgi:hypothetical protein
MKATKSNINITHFWTTLHNILKGSSPPLQLNSFSIYIIWLTFMLWKKHLL